MSIRNTLNENPAITTVVAILVLVVCLGLVIWWMTGSGGGGRISDQSYYFDLNTGEVFTAKTASSPIEAPSGRTDAGDPAGVAAQIFACDGCQASYAGMTPEEIEDSGATLAFLERTVNKPELRDVEEGVTGQVTEVTRPDEIQWVNVSSPAGQRLVNRGLDCPNGETAEPCYPGD